MDAETLIRQAAQAEPVPEEALDLRPLASAMLRCAMRDAEHGREEAQHWLQSDDARDWAWIAGYRAPGAFAC